MYVDRGDPSAPDFIDEDFTKDNDWYELPLAGIVPAGAANKLVYLTATLPSSDISFRTPGNANEQNVLYLMATGTPLSGWVLMDSSRNIEYKINGGAVTGLTVRGWFQ
jgi:hypothetical protein